MSVDLKEVELYGKVPKGYLLVGIRPFKKGESFIGSQGELVAGSTFDAHQTEIRMIVKRKTKTVTTAFIEVPFCGAAKYEVTSVHVDPPCVGRVILPVLSVRTESKEVPDEC